MWFIDIHPDKALKYARKLREVNSIAFFDKTKLKKYVDRNLQNTKSYQYITEDKFTEYLDATPERLIELHQELFNHLYANPNEDFCQSHFTEYRKDVANKVTNPRHGEYSVIGDDELDALKAIFNYGAYISGNKEFSYWIAELLHTNTCTYCNRQYTLTINDSVGNHIIRPEFDHWFAQSLYPDLALSFYNLIPSCSFCNSILKNAKETELETHVHPYLDKDKGYGFEFSYVENPQGDYSVDTIINTTDVNYRSKVENTLALFKIKEVYNAHADLELMDMIELAKANPGDYIDTLLTNTIASTNLDKETVFRLLFGVESKPEKYLNRPMSKFKNDIMKKIHDNIINNGRI